MVFSSIVFICIFLPISFLVYNVLPSIRMKNLLLIAVSLIFYAYGEPVYIILMLVSTVVNYLFGLLLGKVYNDKSIGRLILSIAVIFNLSLLGVYKYADMLCRIVSSVFRIKLVGPGLDLPIGISFYTFQAMSYIIDIYRGEVKAQKNYLNVLLYISFFPQLIAGPIVKYHDIESQIQSRKQTAEDVAKGLRRFIIGLSKKVLISNVLAVAADNIFGLEISQVNIFGAWIGAVAYMLQIYYDFSGYSDMAIGLGAMFGFKFNENFRYPYASESIREFWRRWHISLSTWFKEYLYIPLGGNRKGRVRSWINRLIVFFLTGLWHGANWTFVIWGLYFGLLLLLEDIIRNSSINIKLPVIIKRMYTLLAVCVGFVMFRSATVAYGFAMINKMFTGWSFNSVAVGYAVRQCTPLFIIILVLAVIGQYPWLPYLKEKSDRAGGKNMVESLSYAACIVLLLLCILSLSSGSYNPFIYFRF